MAGCHQFAEIRDLAAFERLNGCGSTCHFAYHVTRTFLSDRVGDSALYLFPVLFGQFRQVLDRFHFADLLQCRLTLTNTVVIRTAIEVVRAVGVGDNNLNALQLNGHMGELHRVAVEVDSVIFLALRAGELIHDTAHHTGVLMLASLTDKGQLRTVCFILRVLPTHLFREGTCSHHLHGGTTAQTCTGGYVSEIQQVITTLQFRLRMTAGDDIDTAQRVVTPCAVALRLDLRHRNSVLLRHVQRLETQHVIVVFRYEQPCTETQCTGEYATAVIVGVLADQIHAPGGKIHFVCLVAISLFKSLL